MFANPWGFIISVLPHSSNFLYLLLGAYFPQIFFLILPTQLKCHLLKETWDDYSHNNTPALSTLPLISPYLIFFSELAVVWSYLVYLFVYFLITTSPSLSTEQNHQDCRERGYLAEIWSSVLVLLLAHSMYPIRIFWRKKKNEMTPLFSSWGPYLQNERPGLDQWFSKWISRTNASWELVRNADSQVQLHTNHVRDSEVGPQDLWFSSPAGAWMFTRVWGPLYHMISEASF